MNELAKIRSWMEFNERCEADQSWTSWNQLIIGWGRVAEVGWDRAVWAVAALARPEDQCLDRKGSESAARRSKQTR